MALRERFPKRDFVVVGNNTDKGEVESAYGLLADIKPDDKFENRFRYELVQRDGSSLWVAGCGSIDAKLGEECVGAFVEFTFRGWKPGKNGQDYRDVKVEVDAEPTEQMQAWPRWQEIQDKLDIPF